MIDVREASEDEMIFEFLKMEYHSDRFRGDLLKAMEKVGTDAAVLSEEKYDNQQCVLIRRQLLGAYRGYPDRDLFMNYPKVKRWKLVRLEAGDLDKLRYVDYDYWNEISNHTGRPKAGAETVLKQIEIFGVSNVGFWSGYHDLCNGQTFPPMILLTADEKTYLILEGHKRATIYGMKSGSEKESMAYVGLCDKKALQEKDKNIGL